MDDVQAAFMKAVREGKNCCLTGGGGVGKTYTINEMRKATKKKKISMTALTGLASMHVDGTTIHKFSGLGGWNKPFHIAPIKRCDKWPKITMRIKGVDIVIIDEISMMRSDQFDLLDIIFKNATGNFKTPFGGKQIIVVGDFLQLPPVVKDDEDLENYWAFQSKAWVEGDFQTFHLTEIKRQSDETFINVLNEIRFGKCGLLSQAILKARSGLSQEVPIKLVAKNKQADEYNHFRISGLEGKPYFLKHSLEYSGLLDEHINDANGKVKEKLEKYKKQLYKDIKAMVNVNDTIWLKDGARVMIMANNDEKGYVNGMTGELIEINYMVDTSSRKYMTADGLLEHREIPFEYVTEKRWVKKKGHDELVEQDIETSLIKIPCWKEVGDSLRNWLNTQVQWGDFNPTFTAQIRLDNGNYVYVEKKTYEIKDNKFTDEYIPMISYTQFPLRPAYAISIHKSQGMTLDCLEVECEGMFAEGQMYVALSRAKSLDGLFLKNFSPRFVKANPDAVEFYKNLEQ